MREVATMLMLRMNFRYKLANPRNLCNCFLESGVSHWLTAWIFSGSIFICPPSKTEPRNFTNDIYISQFLAFTTRKALSPARNLATGYSGGTEDYVSKELQGKETNR